MITFKHKGNFNNTDRFFDKALRLNEDIQRRLYDFGMQGVEALSSSTPIDTGATASSWGFTVTTRKDLISITWTNSHYVKDVPIAIILQYGHGTGTGGYVQGRDYINPAMRPIFDSLAKQIWEEVTNL